MTIIRLYVSQWAFESSLLPLPFFWFLRSYVYSYGFDYQSGTEYKHYCRVYIIQAELKHLINFIKCFNSANMWPGT